MNLVHVFTSVEMSFHWRYYSDSRKNLTLRGFQSTDIEIPPALVY
jgi:hypothetical protein